MILETTTVLDKGFIELTDMMPHPSTGVEPDLAVVNAARTSMLGESKGAEADKKLLFYLMRNHHTTPFEMVNFKFRVKAPLVVWWQWVRHRTWSFNAQSGRYTPFEEDDFYVPDVWRAQSASNKQGSSGVIDEAVSGLITKSLIEHYERSFFLYEAALKDGVAKEQARLFLPGFSVYYTWVCSIDAKNLMDFIRLRNAPDAQYEIREYAGAIYENYFKKLMPWTAEAFDLYVLGKQSE